MKFILFDLDGTLTNPKEGITKCVSHALKHFGIEKNPDDLTEFIGPPLKEQFMEYASLCEKDGEIAVRIYRERFAPIGIFENKIYDGILPMLEKLKENKKILAVATSKPQIFAERIVEKYGIAQYMDLIVGSELDGHLTDKAQVIEKAMKILHAETFNTIMVGDRKHDLIGAKKNSIQFIGVSYGYALPGELEENGADIIVSTPKELCNILLSH